ncbi:hypothetical protein [Pedobacter sp.]|uniref:hypothetical protein n=1 Tax=Pedobacter sp. TaxID=1411316 RepID=UPI003C336DDD
MEWQSIETAPKDGTIIVVVVEGKRMNQDIPYCPSLAYWEGEGWVDPDDDEPGSWFPTHWIGLPNS